MVNKPTLHPVGDDEVPTEDLWTAERVRDAINAILVESRHQLLAAPVLRPDGRGGWYTAAEVTIVPLPASQ